MAVNDVFSTPAGLITPGLNYDLILAHDSTHTHNLTAAKVVAFLDEFAVVRYQAETASLIIGILPAHITGATLKIG